MIQTEKLNEKLIRTYSDAGFKIKRDGVIYDEAVDPIELNRKYTETDIPASQSEKLIQRYWKNKVLCYL